MGQVRRIGAYGLCRDGDRILLARAAAASPFPGVWQVPGGGLRHGEHPADALLREIAEKSGLTVEISGLRAVVAEVWRVPELDLDQHTGRVVYDVRPTGGALRVEAGGSTDLVEWVPVTRLAGMVLMPFTAELLGQPVTALPAPRTGPSDRLAPVPGRLPGGPARRQRFAAYGLVTDPVGRILLTRIAPGYPGAGRWHLPGGGTDHGEQPVTGLLRELVEETGQLGRVTGLLAVTHLRNRAALGPEGFPIDWHGVRVTYRVSVAVPTEPVVTDVAGSTDAAAWFHPAELVRLSMTEVAVAAIAHLSSVNAEEMTEVDSSATLKSDVWDGRYAIHDG